jgi:dTDP-4-dehydrorhamnose reductase
MTLLVFGRSGQLGTALAAAEPDAIVLDRTAADLSRPGACAAAIRNIRPQAVINTAAFTDVDGAETQPDLAERVNAEAPGEIARTCADLGIPMVHVSTDHVFPGTGDLPFRPGDPVHPVNRYGASKARGDAAVLGSGAVACVLRTSWVFDLQGHGFVQAILAAARRGLPLNVVADQIGGPTSAPDLARACLTVARHLRAAPRSGGLFHFAGGPDVSRADFARTILAAHGLPPLIRDTRTDPALRPARRPLNSRLDMTATTEVFGLGRPDWRRPFLLLADRGSSPHAA